MEQQVIITYILMEAACEKALPDNFVKSVTEMISTASAKERREFVTGIKQGLNQSIAMTEMWPYQKYSKADTALRERGLPPLDDLIANLNDKSGKLLKKRRLESDEDYYLAMEMLNNLESGLTARQRRALEKKVSAYVKLPSAD